MKNFIYYKLLISFLIIGLNSNYYRLLLIDNGRTLFKKEYALILLKSKTSTFLPLENLYKSRKFYIGYLCENKWEVYQTKKVVIDLPQISNRLFKIRNVEIEEEFFDQEKFTLQMNDMKIRRKSSITVDFEKEEKFYVIDRIKVFSDTDNEAGDFKGVNLQLEKNKLIFLRSVNYILDFFKISDGKKQINIDFDIKIINIENGEKNMNFELKMGLKSKKNQSDIPLQKLNIIQKRNSLKMKKKYKFKREEQTINEERLVLKNEDVEIGFSPLFIRNKEKGVILYCDFILDGINRLHRVKQFKSNLLVSQSGRKQYVHTRFTKNDKDQYVEKDFIYFCFEKTIKKMLYCDLENVKVTSEINSGDLNEFLNVQIHANCKNDELV